MKILIATFLALSNFAYAYSNSYIEQVSEDFCPTAKYDQKNNRVVCESSNAESVLNAKVEAQLSESELKNLAPFGASVIDMGIVPDDSSDIIFNYTRWLVDSENRKVGYIEYQGWKNSEMESSARFDLRFNLKGELVSLEESTL